MAQPNITRISRTSTSTDPYWQGHTTGQANYDVGAASTANSGVHLYAIDASSTTTYTYAELFAAISAHADFTITTSFSGGENFAARTYSVTYGVSNHSAVFYLRSGTLRHETPESTAIVLNPNIWFPIIGAPAVVDNVGSALADVGVSYRHANTGTDTTAYTGRHEITIGFVHIQTTTAITQLSNYPDSSGTVNSGTAGQIRPVDGGFPQKVSSGRTPSGLKASLGFFGLADGQSCLITQNRLLVEYARSGNRQDFDLCGSGLVEADFSIRKSGNPVGFAHNVLSNPNNDLLVNMAEDVAIGPPGSQVTVLNEPSGAFEVFSFQPDLTVHPYLNQTTRSNAPFDAINRNIIGLGAQYFPAFTGANNFNTSANRENMVIHSLPFSGIQYWQQQWDSNDVDDVAWLDPAIQIETSNTPFERVESTNNSRRFQLYFLRSAAVNNRDASMQPKSSFAYTVGNQKSALTLSHDGSWINPKIPHVRPHSDGGTWSVRNIDQTGAGLENVVGRGAHYLYDAAIGDNQEGNSSNHYVRYTDSSASGNIGDNVSYLVHRGGIHRYQQNISLRTHNWNFLSRGASGALFNNDVDDIPGVTDNLVNMFKQGLLGRATSSADLISNASGTVVIDGLPNVTQHEVDNMVGASLIVDSGHAIITAASRTNATTVSLTVTAGSSGFGQTDNEEATIYWDSNTGYRWNIGSSGTNDITITLQGSTNISWDYSAVAALVQAKIENVVEIKRTNMGSEAAMFGNGNDSTFGGSNIVVNTLLERLLQNTTSAADKSFVRKNTTTGTTLDLLRVNYSVPSGSSLTLNPDEFITHMNYGSSFTIPARVTHNGVYTDSTGTPNFINVTLPTGVATSDVKFAVAYQAFRPLTTYESYTGIMSGPLSFDTNGTLVTGEWQAVTRPSASGTDTLLSTLPTSWDWTPSAAGSVQRVIMRQDTNLTSANRTALQSWINGSNTNYVVAITTDLSAYAIYEASDASLQGSAVAMNLRLLTSTGVPTAANVVWYFNVNSSGAAVTNTTHNGNWQIGSTPTITTANNRTFLMINSHESNLQETNSNNVWYLSAVGGKINPVRQMFTGAAAADTTIELTVDDLRPASSNITKTGTITVVPYNVTSPGSNTELKILLTEDTSYPSEQMEDVDRLGLFINQYNSATDRARTQIDVGDALNSTLVAKYVAVNGVAAIENIIRIEDANLLDTHWRIRYDGCSQIDFLKMDGLLPTTVPSNANYFEVDPADNDAVCFFNAPEFSPAEVQSVVEATVDEQTSELRGLLSNVSLGIPV